jgi:hypothetical protein
MTKFTIIQWSLITIIQWSLITIIQWSLITIIQWSLLTYSRHLIIESGNCCVNGLKETSKKNPTIELSTNIGSITRWNFRTERNSLLLLSKTRICQHIPFKLQIIHFLTWTAYVNVKTNQFQEKSPHFEKNCYLIQKRL